MPSPESRLSEALQRRLAAVRLIVFDVDGVLTDGGLGGDGPRSRRWNVKDGFGFYLARQAGLALALCSGYDHPEIRERAEILRLRSLKLGRLDKGAAIRELMEEHRLRPGELIFVGDDLFDLPGMRAAGLGAVPADAAPELKAQADWVLEASGGHGAAREVIDAVLRARGDWERVVGPFLEASDA
jgi:YrbI family 3-deoxy-D-manno-octulosonate 8-phosphate phosphatase